MIPLLTLGKRAIRIGGACSKVSRTVPLSRPQSKYLWHVFQKGHLLGYGKSVAAEATGLPFRVPCSLVGA